MECKEILNSHSKLMTRSNNTKRIVKDIRVKFENNKERPWHIEWSEIEAILSPIYASKTGRPSYPLLTLFRGLLLGIWCQLSDVQLAQSLYRDLLFRKFCRLELDGDVPEASTLGRFRTQLVEQDIWDRLLGEINRN